LISPEKALFSLPEVKGDFLIEEGLKWLEMALEV